MKKRRFWRRIKGRLFGRKRAPKRKKVTATPPRVEIVAGPTVVVPLCAPIGHTEPVAHIELCVDTVRDADIGSTWSDFLWANDMRWDTEVTLVHKDRKGALLKIDDYDPETEFARTWFMWVK